MTLTSNGLMEEVEHKLKHELDSLKKSRHKADQTAQESVRLVMVLDREIQRIEAKLGIPSMHHTLNAAPQRAD